MMHERRLELARQNKKSQYNEFFEERSNERQLVDAQILE